MKVLLNPAILGHLNFVLDQLASKRDGNLALLKARCDLIGLRGMDVIGCVDMHYNSAGHPLGCTMYFDADQMMSANTYQQRAIISHEIGHIITCRRYMGHVLSEKKADAFALSLGYITLGAIYQRMKELENK